MGPVRWPEEGWAAPERRRLRGGGSGDTGDGGGLGLVGFGEGRKGRRTGVVAGANYVGGGRKMEGKDGATWDVDIAWRLGFLEFFFFLKKKSYWSRLYRKF